MIEPFESRLQTLAREFQYPATPAAADSVMSRIRGHVKQPRAGRKLAWALAMLIVLLAGLMLVAPVRAAVLEFIQIGIVHIFTTPLESLGPTTEAPLTTTPAQKPSNLIPLLETLAGETTLESARNIVDFPIPLPLYPAKLGQPDRVFLQNADGWMVILIWLDPGQPDHVQMSMHLIEAGSWAIKKFQPTVIEETTIHGQRALWTAGPYPLMLSGGNVDFTRLIDGHVLIWEENKITYRLETNLALDEAVRIAESLQAP